MGEEGFDTLSSFQGSPLPPVQPLVLSPPVQPAQNVREKTSAGTNLSQQELRLSFSGTRQHLRKVSLGIQLVQLFLVELQLSMDASWKEGP